MDLSLVSILLIFCAASVTSYPRNPDVVKNFYNRQILQPIPGYIPVYIQTEEHPIIKTSAKLSPNYQTLINNTGKNEDTNPKGDFSPNVDEIDLPPKEGQSLGEEIQLKSKSSGKIELLKSTGQK